MSLPLIIYLSGVANDLQGLAGVLILLSVLGFVAFAMLYADSHRDSDDEAAAIRGLKKTALSVAICMLVIIVVPSQTTIYTMLAAHGVESVASSEQVQRIAPKSLEYLEHVLDNAIEEAATND